jgi:hypothetical protein
MTLNIVLVLALATLGDSTKIEMTLPLSRRLRSPRQVQSCVTIAGIVTNKCPQ